MIALADRVKETVSAVTGTPTTSLTTGGAADASFQTFNAAFGLNKPFSYVALDGDNWQTGTAHMSSSTNMVMTALGSSSSGSALTLTTAAVVFCNPSAAYFKKINGKILAMSKSAAMP